MKYLIRLALSTSAIRNPFEELLTKLSVENAFHVLEIIEARLKKTSTIFCTPFSPKGWHSKL